MNIRCEDVSQCALPAWISDFKDVTFETRVLSIPPTFVDYLLSNETLVLPASMVVFMKTYNLLLSYIFDAFIDKINISKRISMRDLLMLHPIRAMKMKFRAKKREARHPVDSLRLNHASFTNGSVK